jgi:hypothetical protein
MHESPGPPTPFTAPIAHAEIPRLQTPSGDDFTPVGPRLVVGPILGCGGPLFHSENLTSTSCLSCGLGWTTDSEEGFQFEDLQEISIVSFR